MALHLKRGYILRNTKFSFRKTVVLPVVALLLAVQSLVMLDMPSALASSPVEIASVADLQSAIRNQADGQTWTIAAGSYALTPLADVEAGCPSSCQTGWYMPITANNITINGVGNPTLYGDGFAPNGAWASQNLVTVFGNNVTINGLTLMPKISPNKTLEVVGADFTLRNTTFTPNTLVDNSVFAGQSTFAKEWGGSLYFSHAGNHRVEDVTIRNGGVSFRYSPSGTNIEFSNVNLEYATADDFINGYRYSSEFNLTGSSIVGAPHVTYRVSQTLANLDTVLSKLQDGDKIVLDSDLTVTKQLTLPKSVTLDGNGHTIFANYAYTDNSNNSAILVSKNDTTIKNLTVDGTAGTGLQGINIYQAQNVVLQNVTSKNNDKSGVNVNGSTVTIDGITTADNGWHGVDVDKAGAVLTIRGVNQHSDNLPVYVDNTAVGQVIDTTGLYASRDSVIRPNDRVYALKPATPTQVSPVNNSSQNVNDFYFDWSDVAGATEYEFQSSQSSAVTDGVLSSVVWNNKQHGGADRKVLIDSRIHSYGANGTWYWQVRSINAQGIASDWSSVWKMTIDMVAPNAPSLSAPANNAFVNGASLTNSWTAVSDAQHYVYESYHDADATSLRWRENTTATSKTVTSVPDATFWWRVKAVDAAGNSSAWSPLWKVTVDSTVPTVGIASATQVSSDKLEFSGYVNDTNLSHYYCWLTDTSGREVLPTRGENCITTWAKDLQRNGNPATSTNQGDGSVASPVRLGDFDISALSSGKYTIRLMALDRAGNRSVEAKYDFEIDRTAPSIVVTGAVRNSDGTYTISGTSDDTATVLVSVGGILLPPVSPVNGVWEVRTIALNAGSYNVTATSTDARGNQGVSTPSPYTFSVTGSVQGTQDQPALSVATPSAGTSGRSGNQTLRTVGSATPLAYYSAPWADETTDASSESTPVQTVPQVKAATDSVMNSSDEMQVTGSDSASSTYGVMDALRDWWYLMLLVVAGGLWWLIAALRRRKKEDE